MSSKTKARTLDGKANSKLRKVREGLRSLMTNPHDRRAAQQVVQSVRVLNSLTNGNLRSYLEPEEQEQLKRAHELVHATR